MNRRVIVAKVMVRAVVAAAVGGFLVVGATGTALAATPTGTKIDTAMSPLEVLGVYAGIPIGLFALITLLVMAPSLIRGAGQQPGVAWDGKSEWFGVQTGDGVPAVASSSGTDGESATGQASIARETAATDESPDPGSGGAGGRW